MIPIKGQEKVKNVLSWWIISQNREKLILFLVDIGNLIEVRQGYATDGLHKAAKKIKFQERAPVRWNFWKIKKKLF